MGGKLQRLEDELDGYLKHIADQNQHYRSC
jgi:hypothetical protein